MMVTTSLGGSTAELVDGRKLRAAISKQNRRILMIRFGTRAIMTVLRANFQ
jgi:hypothetical protein